MSYDAVEFVHSIAYNDLSAATKQFAKRCLIDLIGVAAVGSTTELSGIIQRYSTQQHMGTDKTSRLLFSDAVCSPAGAALANAMTIDSMDAHDGHKSTKGHVGCGVLPALLAFSQAENIVDEQEFLTSLVVAYEIGVRAGISLHRTVQDYHTSGAWVSIACAAIGARILGLSENQTRQAIGIAEYHGPRSQMMRVIDHPTMLKDGSGWGAMAGVSSAYLAAAGFTGAPAISVEADNVEDLWSDLGSNWRIHEQYFKAYPVCRWAQPPVEAAISLVKNHQFNLDEIEKITVSTFHEAKRLATANPKTTEEAQYSLPFATALALKFGTIGPREVDQKMLSDREISRLANLIVIIERDEFNREFPEKRFAEVSITTRDGKTLTSAVTEALGDPEAPFTDDTVRQKFHHYTDPLLGEKRSQHIETVIQGLGAGDQLKTLFNLIHKPL